MSIRTYTAIWGQFIKRLDWPAVYAGGVFTTFGTSPMMIVPTGSLTESQLRAQIEPAESFAVRRAWPADLLLVGALPLPAVRSYLASDPAVGLLGERDGDAYTWATALWLRCDTCNRIGVYSETGSWRSRPCGHNSGPWHCRDANVPAIGRAWADASYIAAAQHNNRKARS